MLKLTSKISDLMKIASQLILKKNYITHLLSLHTENDGSQCSYGSFCKVCLPLMFVSCHFFSSSGFSFLSLSQYVHFTIFSSFYPLPANFPRWETLVFCQNKSTLSLPPRLFLVTHFDFGIAAFLDL